MKGVCGECRRRGKGACSGSGLAGAPNSVRLAAWISDRSAVEGRMRAWKVMERQERGR